MENFEIEVEIIIWKATRLIIDPLRWRVLPHHRSTYDSLSGKDPIELDRHDYGYEMQYRGITMYRFHLNYHYIHWFCFQFQFRLYQKSPWYHKFPSGYNSFIEKEKSEKVIS